MSPAVDSAVEKDSLFIPLIDFSLFLHGSPTEKKEAASAILSGFQNAGFLYLKNHGIPSSKVDNIFRYSAEFFTLPQQEKDKLAWYSAKANRGYTAHGREKVTQLTEKGDVEALRQTVPDLKESLEIGKEGEESCPNMWVPEDTDGGWGGKFKMEMLEFFQQCKELHIQVMRAIAVGLGIDEAWFDGYTDGGDNTLRLLHYPPVKKEVFDKNPNQVRAGEHSDYGSITLLFQDSHGGLQVESPHGTFIDATPIPGTIVINAGDLLARWANDTIKSTKHRVVEPPLPPTPDQDNTYPARYSIAYFCNPNFDRLVEVIPNTVGKEGRKYKGVNSGDYLIMRLEATY